jgi:hypothetical protein
MRIMTRWLTRELFATVGFCSALIACSSEDDPSSDAPLGGGADPGVAGDPTAGGAGAGGAGAVPMGVGVANYDRPLGMPIGQGASGSEDPPDVQVAPGAAGAGPDDAEIDQEVEIPVLPPMDDTPPCTGCVELNVDVDDINQRDNFVFAPGMVNVTRVVWTIIVPFNSDQLFVQPFVDNSYGTFTDLDANAFAVDTPIQLVHEYSGAAGTVGLAVGSSGAWTGNMTMSVFVDSVTLEGAAATASRTFDTDPGGLVVGSNAHNPKIVYHP